MDGQQVVVVQGVSLVPSDAPVSGRQVLPGPPSLPSSGPSSHDPVPRPEWRFSSFNNRVMRSTSFEGVPRLGNRPRSDPLCCVDPVPAPEVQDSGLWNVGKGDDRTSRTGLPCLTLCLRVSRPFHDETRPVLFTQIV